MSWLLPCSCASCAKLVQKTMKNIVYTLHAGSTHRCVGALIRSLFGKTCFGGYDKRDGEQGWIPNFGWRATSAGLKPLAAARPLPTEKLDTTITKTVRACVLARAGLCRRKRQTNSCYKSVEKRINLWEICHFWVNSPRISKIGVDGGRPLRF